MRRSEESTFQAFDQEPLFYRYWPSLEREVRGAVVLLHRGHEHSGRLQHLVDELELPGFAFFAPDARGHGRSPGPRGDSPSIAAMVADLQAFVEHLKERHGLEPSGIAVVAQSIAAVLAAGWVHDYAPPIRGLVLAAPAFRVRLYVPLARPALKLGLALRGNFFVKSYVKARYLTHDSERIASFEADPLIAREVSVRNLLGLDALAKRILADAEAITVPTQLLISGSDWVVEAGPQHEFFERLGSATKTRTVLPGFYHDTLGERDRGVALADLRRFLLERFDAPLERVSQRHADRIGPARREADRLARPLSRFSLEGLYWGLVRAGLKLCGRFSEGVRLGLETGFDSGASLDYVYRNVPSGRTVLGGAIDRVYLDAIGWRGIRVRKRHVETLIHDAIERLGEEGEPVRIVDVAAGAGRYVLDALVPGAESLPARGRADELQAPPSKRARDRREPELIELRDYDADNVRSARALARERGLESVATSVVADAFGSDQAPDSPEAAPRFTLGVVSGLYELYADNEPVLRSLKRLAAEIEVGGYLVYTGQPWHPQLEFIARALTSHRDGRPWVMRRRSQAELDELVAAAGFEKITERVDPWGIFTVSLARRVERAADAARSPTAEPTEASAAQG